MVLVSIKKIYQTLKTMFDHISKHFEVHQKYSTGHCTCTFNSLIGVWKCGQTWSFVFDILQEVIEWAGNDFGIHVTYSLGSYL